MKNRLNVLLRDHDYRYDTAGNLWSKGIPGYTSDRLVGFFGSIVSACDYLCSIVGGEFTDRYVKMTN